MTFFRTWQGWVIAIVIAVQAALPLRYYLGHRDPHDERFAWRMFSPMRMTACRPEANVDGRPFELGREFHEAWIEIAKRGRFTVVEKMAERLCRTHREVTIRLHCRYIDREPVVYGGFNLCEAPQI